MFSVDPGQSAPMMASGLFDLLSEQNTIRKQGDNLRIIMPSTAEKSHDH